jgi:hypothetical protein
MVPGLMQGRKVSVVYSAESYGTPPAEQVLIDKPKTEHTVRLYRNIDQAIYWTEISAQVGSAAARLDPKHAIAAYGQQWNTIYETGLSPEVKFSAANAFSKYSIQTPAAAPALPESLTDYSKTDLTSIQVTKEGFIDALQGNTRLNRQAVVPGSVAADIAVFEMNQSNRATLPSQFLVDFKSVYGENAATNLKMKVAAEDLKKPAVRNAK